jgi:hypothetical protein
MNENIRQKTRHREQDTSPLSIKGIVHLNPDVTQKSELMREVVGEIDDSPLSIKRIVHLNPDVAQKSEWEGVGQIDDFDGNSESPLKRRKVNNQSPVSRSFAQEMLQSVFFRDEKEKNLATTKIRSASSLRSLNALSDSADKKLNALSLANRRIHEERAARDVIRYRADLEDNKTQMKPNKEQIAKKQNAIQGNNQVSQSDHLRHSRPGSLSTIPSHVYFGQSPFEATPRAAEMQQAATSEPCARSSSFPNRQVRPLQPPPHLHRAQTNNESRNRAAPDLTSRLLTPPTPILMKDLGTAPRPDDGLDSMPLRPGMVLEIGGRNFRVGYAFKFMTQEQVRRLLESVGESRPDSAERLQTPPSSPSRPW